jgi:hypothetical protein
MAGNGLGIGEEWEFEKQKLISVPKFNSGRMLKCSTSAFLLPIHCCTLFFFGIQHFTNYFKINDKIIIK